MKGVCCIYKKAFFYYLEFLKAQVYHVWSEKVEMNIKNLHLPSKLYYRYQLIWEGGTNNSGKK